MCTCFGNTGFEGFKPSQNLPTESTPLREHHALGMRRRVGFVLVSRCLWIILQFISCLMYSDLAA